MEQTQYFPNEIKQHFNLRSPKSAKPTNVYLTFYIRGKQYKVSLNVKVYPSQWSKEKQMAIVSNIYSDIDNKNNSIVNEKIKIYSKHFVDFLYYLCSNDGDDVVISALIKQVFYKDMKKRKQPTIRNLIDEGFEYYITYIVVDISEESKKLYRRQINNYIEFVESHYNGRDYKALTQDGVNSYREYLISNLKNKKWGYTYVNESGRILRAIINNVFTTQNKFRDIYKFEKVSFHKIKDQRKGNDKGSFSLEKDEITAFLNCKDLPIKQEQYRRFFMLQMALGSREGGVKNVLKEHSIDKDGKVLSYESNKTRRGEICYAHISLDPLYDGYPSIGEFLLGDKRPDLSLLSAEDRAFNSHYKQALVKIATKLGLNRIHEYADKCGEIQKAPIYKIIHGHCARHTFITQALRAGRSEEEVCAATAHTDDTMIRTVYAHLTKEDKIEQVKGFREKRMQSNESNLSNDRLLDVVKKSIILEQNQEKDNARDYIIKVAEEFGLDWKQWICSDSLSNTENLLYDWSEKIHDQSQSSIGVSMLKKFFNDNKGDIEKAKMQLLEYLAKEKNITLLGRPIEDYSVGEGDEA